MPARGAVSERRRRGRVSSRALAAELRREQNELKRKMLLVGYLSSELAKKGASVFLVGGQAVEAYSGGQFTTGDIDLTTTDDRATAEALTRLGFKKEGMIWLNEKLAIAVHLVGSYPARAEKARTVIVGPYRVTVIGVEELILDRLKAAKSWKSGRDLEQASVLYGGHRSTLDLAYLRRRAKEDGVDDLLQKVRADVGKP
jgi:hypothetical protein